MPRPFEFDDSNREPPQNADDAILRGREYRHRGALQNALDLYRSFSLSAELSELAEDAWLAGAVDICREALELTRNARQLLIYAKVLRGYPFTTETIERYERAAAEIRRPRRRGSREAR